MATSKAMITGVLVFLAGFGLGQWLTPIPKWYYASDGNPVCWSRTCQYWKSEAIIMRERPIQVIATLGVEAEWPIEQLLYPQYASEFTLPKNQRRVLPLAVWEKLQRLAKAEISRDPIAVDSVSKHWKSIADGIPPFGLRLQQQTKGQNDNK